MVRSCWVVSIGRRISSRRHVWHAGFENAKEAQELAAQIDKLLTQPRAGPEERLRLLQQEYELITGERYEPGRERK